MKCPQCSLENKPNKKFCTRCGAELSLKCPNCDAEIEAGDFFCGECGQNLRKSSEALPIDPSQPQSYTPKFLADKILTSRNFLEGERKHVTILFADIKGSTELIDDVDPEAAQQVLDPAIQIMMNSVHRYEGTVNQVLGDGIMALFGAPIAHEDHALRACYAALAMQKAMDEYTKEVRQSHGVEMRIRVGLNSGEVVVRTIGNDLHMDYSAVGSTTHLAARMEQMATPGTTRLTKETLRLVKGFIRVNTLGPLPVKGIAEPPEVFELVGANTVRRRLQAAVARGLSRFVGRDKEIEELNRNLELVKAANGQVVAVVGEAGVGKSRMVYEFVQSHRTEGWLVLESASVSYGKATPYSPIVGLLKRYVHAEEEDDTRAIRAKVTGQILNLDESLQETIPALLFLMDTLPEDSPFLQLDPMQRRDNILNSIRRVLIRESRRQPLLVIFEDLHWIDSETQALLDILIENLSTARLLLLVNYRPEYSNSWASKTYYTRLQLDSLLSDSADVFLQSLLGNDNSLQALKQLLVERTEGNPFFLEECVRTLGETRALAGEPGAYRLVQELPEIHVPATVQALLAARMDRLPPAEKRLLQIAAVIGNEVLLPLLQTIADMPQEGLQRGLAHLQAADFLYEISLYPEQIYSFKHALTQNVAYRSLLVSKRKKIHQRIGRVLEKQFGDVAEKQPELLAHHYTEAGCHREAAVYWRRAGERASARSAYVVSIAYLNKGLKELQMLPEKTAHAELELALQFDLASSLIVSKAWIAPEVEQAYARALDLCRQVGETPTLISVLQGLRRLYAMRGAPGDAQRAQEMGEQILTQARRRNDTALLQEAHWAIGQTHCLLGKLEPARTHMEQSSAAYTPQPLNSQAARDAAGTQIACLVHNAYVLWSLGYPDKALETSQQALSLAHELSHPFTLAFAFYGMAQLNQFRRDVQATLKHAEAMIAHSKEQGFPVWMTMGTLFRAWCLAMQGQPADGIAQMEQTMASNPAGSFYALRPWHDALLIEAYGSAGQIEEGLNKAAEALVVVEKGGFCFYEAELRRLYGELLLMQSISNSSEAETCMQQAFKLADKQQSKSLELRAAISLSRLWNQQDKIVEARKLLTEIFGWFTEGFGTADLKIAKTILDELLGKN